MLIRRGCSIATTNTPHLYVIDHPSVPTDNPAPSTTYTSSNSIPSLTPAISSAVFEYESAPGSDMNAQQLGPSVNTYTGATYEKHSHIATCVVHLSDAVSVLVGDEVGGITLYSLMERGRLNIRGRYVDNGTANVPRDGSSGPGSEECPQSARVLQMQVAESIALVVIIAENTAITPCCTLIPFYLQEVPFLILDICVYLCSRYVMGVHTANVSHLLPSLLKALFTIATLRPDESGRLFLLLNSPIMLFAYMKCSRLIMMTRTASNIRLQVETRQFLFLFCDRCISFRLTQLVAIGQ